MSKPILENLLGSRVRVKLLKLLFRQYPAQFAMSELVKRTQEPSFIARREIKALQSIGLVTIKKAASSGADRERFGLNPDFDFFPELGQLMLKASPTEQQRMTKRIMSLGRVKLAVISGIFLGSQDEQATYDPPADLFLVADDLDKKKLSAFLRSLEAEMGGDVRFAVMDKDQFKYRYDMFDRFIRVLLEGPHIKLINRLDMP
ncbi:MAG TPA: hypothetical protein VD862_01960 [Candidatus Paceibacterota bacterium]|nr:hypothetical protein [Candidatus Paceibacterota bacterium]